MKKTIFKIYSLLLLSVCCIGIGYFVSNKMVKHHQDFVVNAPTQQIHEEGFVNSKVLPIPQYLMSEKQNSQIYGFPRVIELGNEKGLIYVETDDNGDFYSISYSDNLENFFSKIPTSLLFDTYSASGAEFITAGAHSDCMNYCRDNYEKGGGRGGCKANCWIDAVLTLAAAVGDAVIGLF